MFSFESATVCSASVYGISNVGVESRPPLKNEMKILRDCYLSFYDYEQCPPKEKSYISTFDAAVLL